MTNGVVHIVGAGPGDPGLLTLRAAECLREADAVVFDRLVDRRVLALCREDAEFVDVGKHPEHHAVPQGEINRILVRLAREGKSVVRVKGGDPFVFGRGGEECACLRGQGIRYEVVPGVTSAVAVPAYAGIPVTHRDYASSFHVFTGHMRAERRNAAASSSAESSEAAHLDFDAIARLEGTLVFLMGVKNLASICAGLMRSGMDANRSAAVIENGTTASQRVVNGTVGTLAALAHAHDIASPSVTIIGEVAALSERLSWFGVQEGILEDLIPARVDTCESPCDPMHAGIRQSFIPSDSASTKRLSGRTVVLTRPADQAAPMRQALEALGARVILLPLIRTIDVADSSALAEALSRLEKYKWLVFTSTNGVEAFFRHFRAAGRDVRALSGIRIAVIGPVTRDALVSRNLLPEYMAETHTTACLAQGLASRVGKHERILVARSEIAGSEFADILDRAGLLFDEVPVYTTVQEELSFETKTAFLKELESETIDYVTFTSPSTVHAFDALFGMNILAKAKQVRIVAIGPVTAKSCRDAGLHVHATAAEHVGAGILRSIIACETGGTPC